MKAATCVAAVLLAGAALSAHAAAEQAAAKVPVGDKEFGSLAAEYRFQRVGGDGSEVLSEQDGSGSTVTEERALEVKKQAAADEAKSQTSGQLQEAIDEATERISEGEDPESVMGDLDPVVKAEQEAAAEGKELDDSELVVLGAQKDALKKAIKEIEEAKEDAEKDQEQEAQKEERKQAKEDEASQAAAAAQATDDPKEKRKLQKKAAQAMDEQKEEVEREEKRKEEKGQGEPEPASDVDTDEIKKSVDAAAATAAAAAADEVGADVPRKKRVMDNVVQSPVVSDFTPEAVRKAEMEVSSVFSGVITSLVSNLLTQNPDMVRRSVIMRRVAEQQKPEAASKGAPKPQPSA